MPDIFIVESFGHNNVCRNGKKSTNVSEEPAVLCVEVVGV
jgi:hypothetical protein